MWVMGCEDEGGDVRDVGVRMKMVMRGRSRNVRGGGETGLRYRDSHQL